MDPQKTGVNGKQQDGLFFLQFFVKHSLFVNMYEIFDAGN